jgi:glycylpeptide N-tetradecanoyltransferase
MEDKKPVIVKDIKEGSEPKQLTQEDKKNFLEQIKNLRQTQELLKEGNFGAVKTQYKFWSTQPVPQLNRDCEINFGPLIKETNIESIRKDPYMLPEGFEWKEVDLSQSNEVDKLYEFLKSNYIGDESHLFGMEHSKDFLKWYLSPPGMHKEWIISVLKEDKVKNKKKMIGFICAIPCKISVIGTEVQLAKVNFLCVKKEFRNKRLTPVLIQEITRRVNLKNIWQGFYATYSYLPKPFSKYEYYYRNINLKKLIDVQYTYLPPKMSLGKALKNNELPDEPQISGFRKMTDKDLDQIYELITKNRNNYLIYDILSKEEIEHWLLPRNNIIYTYVLEDENNKITDFCSFYGLSRTILNNNNSKYKKINIAYSLMNYNSSISMKDLLKTAIIFAKNNNFDAFLCINSREYSDNFKELLFKEKIGKKKLYFYNFVCPETPIDAISIINI